MSSLRLVVALALLGALGVGCSCDPLIAPPDGGSGGGGTGGGAHGGGQGGGAQGGGQGGGAQGGGQGGGAQGGGQGGGAQGGGAGGGSAGGAGGGAAGGTNELTQYVHDLIVSGTRDTTAPRPESEWLALPDLNPITFTAGFFDGGT